MDGNSGFSLRKADLHWFQGLESAFRNLLKMPALSPEDIVGLARAIRCIQRLPSCTADTDVSVSLEYGTETFEASSTIRLSYDELSADYSAASRLSAEYEFESFPSFTLSIERDGAYDVDGDKHGFFTNFISSTGSITDSESYTVTVVDDSVPQALQPFEAKGT